MKRLLLIGLVAFFAAVGPVPRAAAMKPDRRREGSYSRSIAGGKYVLVVLRSPEDDSRTGKDLRATYKRGGLFAEGDPARPLWGLDWYAAPNWIAASTDGVHLVCWSSGVEFYANGVLVKRYEAEELESGSWQQERPEAELDEVGSRFRFSTGNGDRFVFDLATGAILEEYRFGKAMRGWVSLLFLVLNGGFASAVWVWRRKPKKWLLPAASPDAIRLP